ncbi:MAG: hypothetical protein Q9174_004122 [Haloplaca sp. 1 TL-2023]
MSFGVSVSDFVTLGQLSWKIYKRCKESAGVYVQLTGEVNSLRSVLQETEELLSEQELSSQQERRLLPVRQGCESVLIDLDGLLAKYESLATSTRRGFDRMGMALQDVTSIRQRLTLNVDLLDAFNNSSSQARLHKKLDQLISEVRAGKRERSVISAMSLDLTAVETRETWNSLRRDLEDIGISPQVIKEQRSFILDWFRKAVASGLAEESPPIVEHEGNPYDQSSSERDLDRALGSQQTRARGAPGASGGANPCKDFLGPSTAGPFSNAKPTSQQPRASRIPKTPMSVSYLINRLKGTNTLDSAASIGDRRRIFELLLKGDDVNARDHDGETALHLAVRSSQNPYIEVLLNSGADVNIAGEYGTTVLHLAAQRDSLFPLNRLLQWGADVNARTTAGYTALHYAMQNPRETVLRSLLNHTGIDIEAKTLYGETPLHMFARPNVLCHDMDQPEISHAVVLLEAGANVHARNLSGETPLFLAVLESRIRFVKDLLDFGADVTARTRRGQTVFHALRFGGDPSNKKKIKSLLRAKSAVQKGAHPRSPPY